MSPQDQLAEAFIDKNSRQFNAKCSLDKKLEQLNQLQGSCARLKRVVDAEILEFEQEQQELNTITFNLMLHMPCYQFARVLRMIDL